jgi:hypothetical protein
VANEPLHLPLIPHRTTGAPCHGSIVTIRDKEQIRLQCNGCGAVVGTVHAEILKAWEQAISDSIVLHKFAEADAAEVLTSISEECQRGECRQCPGVFHRPDTGEQPVFCVHSCHKVERTPGAIY